ncbi:MAG: MFS transporter [Acidobacteria bacterium]|nr:MFS transporter [Acidobacteriota bacterium]
MTRRYRWWIGGLLFASTVINYLDRQTLSVLGPYLKTDFRWSNQDFALVVISFRVAYAIGQAFSGRLLDRFGVRRGLSVAVTWYSLVAMLTPLANGLWGFCTFRFLLGSGEAANWPAATKAVGEWFPRRERGWAVALFDSGSSVGAAIAVVLVPFLYRVFGGWRPVFLVVGVLGFFWVLIWRRVYQPPEQKPGLHPDELRLILDDRAAERNATPQVPRADEGPVGMRRLLSFRQTWGAIAARGLTDPVWYMIADWFAIYLVSKGFRIEDTVAGFWIPFLGADLGNFFGGGVSSALIRRGWPVGRARKAVFVGGTFGVLALIPAAFLSGLPALVTCFAIATFSYAAMSTMALALPADLFESRAVASVAGMSGAAAGLGTIASTFAIGVVADRFSFTPILVVASLVPCAAALVVVALVRNTSASGRGIVKAV